MVTIVIASVRLMVMAGLLMVMMVMEMMEMLMRIVDVLINVGRQDILDHECGGHYARDDKIYAECLWL